MLSKFNQKVVALILVLFVTLLGTWGTITAIPVAFMLFLMLFAFATTFVGAHWLPTDQKIIDIVVQEVKSRDRKRLYDLGSGTAKLIMDVAKKTDAKAVGIEIEPLKWLISTLRIRLAGIKNASVRRDNFFTAKLSDADAIYCYLPTPTMKRLEPRIKKLRKGTIIIAHCIKFPTLKPIKVHKRHSVYVYRISE